MGLIDDIQIHKEIGAIALSAIELNLDSTIICGQFNFPVKSILLHKTGFIRRNWITKILDPFFALKYILNESPDYMLLYNIENYGNIFLVLALNFLGKIRLSHKRNIVIMIKADTDGSFVESRRLAPLIVYKVLILLYLRFTKGIIVETSCALSKIANFIKRKKGLVYLPDGYSDKLFSHEYNSERKHKVVCVARIVPIKNLDAVVRLFAKISKVYIEMQFQIIGPVIDTKYFEKIKLQIVQMNMQDKIEIVNPKSNALAEILSESLLTVSMSLKESFGIARMESLGCGTPVVTYDVGCGPDFSNFGAIVVPFGDEERMYFEVLRLLSDLSYWKKKSLESRTSSVTWNSVVQKLISIFQHNDTEQTLRMC